MGADGGRRAGESAPAVSVVIPLYRRTAWIGACLGALAAQECAPPFEVVLVDDGSPNGGEIAAAVAGALAGAPFPHRFFRKENGGPAAARNYGAARSLGSILAFIDDDSVVERSWLREIAAPFRDPRVSVVSGLIRAHNGEHPFAGHLERAVYHGVHWATCNIAYRRELFEGLGGFDERFREASWEDNDLGLRARWGGYLQQHCEGAVVYHPHEESFEEYRQKCLVNGRGAAAFSRKYIIRKPLWALAAPVIMSRHLWRAFCPAAWREEPSVPRLRFLWSWHSLCGYLSVFFGK